MLGVKAAAILTAKKYKLQAAGKTQRKVIYACLGIIVQAKRFHNFFRYRLSLKKINEKICIMRQTFNRIHVCLYINTNTTFCRTEGYLQRNAAIDWKKQET